MNIIVASLLGLGLTFGGISNDEQVETSTITTEEVSESESVSEEVNEEISTDEAEEIEKWLNGDIDVLDAETLQKIEDKLSPITEEQVNAYLEKYIADAEERQKVTAIVMGVLAGLSSLIAIAIFLKKNGLLNKEAKINSDTIAASSKVIEECFTGLKDDFKTLESNTKNMEDNNAKFQEQTETTLNAQNKILKSILGVLQIVYEDEDKEDGKGESQEVQK